MQKVELKPEKTKVRKIIWINKTAYVSLPAEYVRETNLKPGDYMLVRYQGKKLHIEVIEDEALVKAIEQALGELDG